MQFLVAIALPFVACLMLVGVTSAMWWRTFQTPWQFAILGMLVLLGLHRLVQVVAEAIKLASPVQGYFLEARAKPNFLEIARENLNIEALLVTAVVVVAGIPLLLWLRSALPKL
ncbi:hypothetical protein [Caenimonas soli]|uniref:hypothetical protein n=1 Tax=Caenimonas soli TaxID=2735555 RepID=UPI00155382F0|nr:hypothetical protein [Caenimonas soli]NPC55695.1 hypothetical protein [Caenimonas soli]